MRAHPDVAGAVIHDDAVVRQVAYGSGRIVVMDHDDGRAVVRIGQTQTEPGVPTLADEVVREVAVPGHDGVDAHLVHDLLAAQRGVHRGQGGGARLEAPGVGAVPEPLEIETELALARMGYSSELEV